MNYYYFLEKYSNLQRSLKARVDGCSDLGCRVEPVCVDFRLGGIEDEPEEETDGLDKRYEEDEEDALGDDPPQVAVGADRLHGVVEEGEEDGGGRGSDDDHGLEAVLECPKVPGKADVRTAICC